MHTTQHVSSNPLIQTDLVWPQNLRPRFYKFDQLRCVSLGVLIPTWCVHLVCEFPPGKVGYVILDLVSPWCSKGPDQEGIWAHLKETEGTHGTRKSEKNSTGPPQGPEAEKSCLKGKDPSLLLNNPAPLRLDMITCLPASLPLGRLSGEELTVSPG